MTDYNPESWVTGDTFEAADATAMSQELGEQEDYDATQDATLAGKVTGPASATDNAVVRFDSTTGKLVQNSPVTIPITRNHGAHPENMPLGVITWLGSFRGALVGKV
jgi:hypothetical protein